VENFFLIVNNTIMETPLQEIVNPAIISAKYAPGHQINNAKYVILITIKQKSSVHARPIACIRIKFVTSFMKSQKIKHVVYINHIREPVIYI
jgi:hypothetical protein